MRELCIISESTTPRDIEMIFGPCESTDEFIPITAFRDMADIWVYAGFFPSRGQANKNNHGGDIPKGFTDIIKLKRGVRVTIWDCEDLNDDE